jgi:hypothetical protein
MKRASVDGWRGSDNKETDAKSLDKDKALDWQGRERKEIWHWDNEGNGQPSV